MAPEFGIVGIENLVAKLEEYKHRKLRKAQTALNLAGNAYKNDVQACAPYKSGTYRRSIHVQPATNDDLKPYVRIGTDLPQGRRLEFGFFDMTDSLGRHYYQLPQPHFRPPLDTEREKYLAIMRGELVDETYDVQGGLNWGSLNDTVLSSISDAMSGVRPDQIAGAIG